MCGAPHSDTSLHVAGRKATLLATAPSAVVCRGPGPAPHAQAGDGLGAMTSTRQPAAPTPPPSSEEP